MTRYTLGRHGATRFEVIDNAARPVARQHAVLPTTSLPVAQSYTAYLNDCEAQGIAPLVYEDWWMEVAFGEGEQ